MAQRPVEASVEVCPSETDDSGNITDALERRGGRIKVVNVSCSTELGQGQPQGVRQASEQQINKEGRQVDFLVYYRAHPFVWGWGLNTA